jgi:hypothetical protein
MAYVPLFFHQEEDDDDDSDEMSEWSSPDQELGAAGSSGLTSSGMRTTSSKKRQANDGPIIFYNKASFVTDLSGDRRGANVKTVNIQDYFSYPITAVGIPPTSEPVKRLESRGPLSKQGATTIEDSDAMDVDAVISGDSVHGFSEPPSMKTAGSSSDNSPDPIEFEASGVGGVHPTDNFALSVKSRHKLVWATDLTSRSKTYPPRIRAILAESATSTSSSKAAAALSPATANEILASKRKDLPPSKLPPPSYFPVSSPEDVDEDDYSDSAEDSEMSDSALYCDKPLLPPAPKAFKWPTQVAFDSESEDDEDGSPDYDNDGDSSSSSSSSSSSAGGLPDMLAHARKVNPEFIRLAEREYDSTLAERLAKEIPAGSSAATAGGGSGFNSPVSAEEMDVDGDPGQSLTRRTSGGGSSDGKVQHRRVLKRARNSGDGKQADASKSPKLDKEMQMS